MMRYDLLRKKTILSILIGIHKYKMSQIWCGTTCYEKNSFFRFWLAYIKMKCHKYDAVRPATKKFHFSDFEWHTQRWNVANMMRCDLLRKNVNFCTFFQLKFDTGSPVLTFVVNSDAVGPLTNNFLRKKIYPQKKMAYITMILSEKCNRVTKIIIIGYIYYFIENKKKIFILLSFYKNPFYSFTHKKSNFCKKKVLDWKQ